MNSYIFYGIYIISNITPSIFLYIHACELLDNQILMKISFDLLFMWLLIAFTGNTNGVFAQSRTKFVPFQMNDMPVVPYKFYILRVIDTRTETSNIGKVFVQNNLVASLKPSISLGKIIPQYYKSTFKNDSTAYPIEIHIHTFEIEEKIQDKKIIGKCSIGLDFHYYRTNEPVKITHFNNSTNYSRSIGEYDNYQQIIDKILRKSALYLNQWMKVNYDANPQLGQSIKINILPDYGYENPEKGDTIFWHPTRKLRWSDFEGKPSLNNKYAAQVFTNFEYTGNAKMVKGIIQIDLQMKAYMLKSSSWNATAGNSLSALAHEQLHFDITKTIIERFKRKALTISSPEDYDSELQLLFIDMYRTMNQLQKQYDSDSGHSINIVGQEKWRSDIQEELNMYLKM